MSADVPAMVPPDGDDNASAMPLALVTGIISLPGLIDTSARALGLMRPVSRPSRVPLTAETSVYDQIPEDIWAAREIADRLLE